MAKINYNKVEQDITTALRSMYIHKLMKGEPAVSQRAVAFYGLDTGPKPKPHDPVLDELEAIEKEELEFERQEEERKKQATQLAKKEKEEIMEGLQAHSDLPLEKLPSEIETSQELAPQKEPQEEIRTIKEDKTAGPPPIPVIPEREKVPTTDDASRLPPLLLLRRLILWMKKKRVIDVYKAFGTTQEEIQSLKSKEKLTESEEKRVTEILAKGQLMKEKLLKKLGLEDDQKIIEKEYKKHKTKRYNIKDTWLPM